MRTRPSSSDVVPGSPDNQQAAARQEERGQLLNLPAGSSVIVLGAGIAGLAAAEQLTKAGFQVHVLERAPHCGGTHRSRQIGPYTFDVGSIFYEDNARLFDLSPDLRALCPTVLRVQRRIAPSGDILHYPLEPREFLRGSRWELFRAICDFVYSRLAVRRDGTLDAISRKRLGRIFFRTTGLRNYIARFHHVPPEQIDEAFFFHRMAFIERFTRLNTIVQMTMRSLFSRAAVNAKTRRPLHVRPREGFQPLFTRIQAQLEDAGVRFSFNEALSAVTRTGTEFHVQTDAGLHRADCVVSTLPLDTLHLALFGTASGLVSLDMTTLFVSAATLDPQAGNVLFNFHEEGWWKRATIYSRIYPDPGVDREYLAVECTISPHGTFDPDTTFEDFRSHIYALGLGSDLRLEGHEKVEHCYPLYAPGSNAVVQSTLARVAQAGIVVVGRQGRFEYLPTSSGVIRRVGEELSAAGMACEASPEAPSPGMAA